MNGNIKDFFNRIAPNWHNSDDVNVILELLNEAGLSNGDMVLDLGCGKGIITPYLYNITKRKIVAIDISDKMIEEAKKISIDNDKYEFIAGDFYDYKFANKFDYIICYNAYPHFLDVENFKIKAFNVLNDGGKLVIMHSLGRCQLEVHHQNIPTLSRILLEPTKEALLYQDSFRLIKSIDLEDRYLLILEKNGDTGFDIGFERKHFS